MAGILPSGVEGLAGHLGANPLPPGLLGGLGGQPAVNSHAQAAIGLAAIIHNLLGGGAPLGGLAHQLGHHPAPGDLPQQFTPPAPTLPEGTYTGAYAAQGLRTTNPGQAAQLWESRHPYAVHHGNIPNWVTQALLHAIQSATPQAPAAAPVPTNQAQ